YKFRENDKFHKFQQIKTKIINRLKSVPICEICILFLFRIKNQKRNNHFFERNTTMLIGVFVIVHIVIIIVLVCQKIIVFSKNIRTSHVNSRKLNFVCVFRRIHIFIFISKTSSGFVSQIQTRISVTNHLARILYINGSVVCSNDEFHLHLLCLLNHFKQRRILEPTKC